MNEGTDQPSVKIDAKAGRPGVVLGVGRVNRENTGKTLQIDTKTRNGYNGISEYIGK